MLHVQNMICAFFFYAASNPFHKDHQREEAQGAGNTSTLEAVGQSAPGSRPFCSAWEFIFPPGETARTPEWGWTSAPKSGRVCQKRKAYVSEIEKTKTPPAAQTLKTKGKKNTKHIITPQISMLLLDQSFQVVY